MIFGIKTEAWVDLWSIEHFFSGMSLVIVIRYLVEKLVPSLAGNVPDLQREKKAVYLFMAAFFAYAWEALEFYLEAGYTHNDAITYWFQGVEFWGNRLITDPTITVLGVLCGMRWPKYLWPARAFSVVWLALHLFVFPHSMYLQEHVFSF